MASNTILNTGSGGDSIVSRERSHDGDTAKQQGVFLSSAEGSEGAYTWTDLKIVAEDAAHSSGDTGIASMAVRSDTLGALAGTTGDYTPLQVNSDGALYTVIEDDVVDSNNSTTSTLLANTDYTGTGTDILGYSGITVTVFADQDSDTNGLRFEFSTDNTNWDISQTFDYVANTGRQFQFGAQARYFRVAFQNGAAGQTAFRLQTVLHRNPPGTQTIHRADAELAPDRSATLVKSVLMAQQAGAGNFVPIESTAGGNLKVAIEEGVNTPTDNYATPTDAINGISLNMVYDGAAWDFARGDATNGLLVNLGANNDITGTVTANAGTGTFTVDGSGVTQPISASSLPLPTGAATSANQSTANSSLSTIAGDTTSLDGKFAAGAALSDNFANPTTTAVGSFNMVWDGATWDRVPGNATDGVLVNLGANNDISGTVTANAGTGTFTVDGSGVTQPVSGTVTANLGATDNAVLDQIELNTSYGDNTGNGTAAGALRVTVASDSTGSLAVDLGANNDVVVAGDVANDTADSGNPVKVGGKAENDIDTVTLVAADDRVDFRAGRDGIQLVHPDGPLENFVNGNANATGTANTSVIAAQGAGIKTYLTDIIVTNASATDSEVIIKDGTTEKLRISAPANGGAVSVGLRSPIAGTANTAWQFASADAVTTMYVYLGGFTSQI